MDVRNAHVVHAVCPHGVVSKTQFWRRHAHVRWCPCPDSMRQLARAMIATTFHYSTSGVLDYALNLSISLSAGKETKWDSPSNGE